MSSDRSGVIYAVMFVAIFACFLLFVLFTAVTKVRADEVAPRLERAPASVESTAVE
jgi:hypothetical protein